MKSYWEFICIFISIVIGIAAFLLLYKRMLSFMEQKNLFTLNYSGKKIVHCGGLLILIPILLSSIPIFLYNPTSVHAIFILMIPVLTFTGVLDDILGAASSKGLIGHIGILLKGNFSTGCLKAFIGGLLGFVLAWIRYRSLFILFLDVFIFSLSVNVINLFDLRPGRAIKGFVFLLLIITITVKFANIQYILPAISILALYIRGELKEVYMLGDAGSNLLGGILGFYVVMELQSVMKGLILIFLLLIHLLSEFVSLSKLIDKTPWLKKLDMLGREKKRS